jgi:branched-chain amino acid transport system permease protein
VPSDNFGDIGVSGIQKIRWLIWSLLATAGLLLPPMILQSYYIYLLEVVGIYIIIGTGVNLLMGYTGQVTLGHAGFVGIGAYTASLLSAKLGVPFVFSMIGGTLAGAAAGALLALPVLRLHEIYLAMATVAFGIVVQLIIAGWESLTGGYLSLQVPKFSIVFRELTDVKAYYYVIFPATVISVAVAKNIVSSRTGRAFMALRESEHAALSLGINIARYKTISFIVSSAYAAFAGCLFATVMSVIGPMDFGVWQSMDYVIIVVAGGMGTIAGPIYGSVLLVLLREGFRQLKGVQELILGLILMLTILFFPSGLSRLFSTCFAAVKDRICPKSGKEVLGVLERGDGSD